MPRGNHFKGLSYIYYKNFLLWFFRDRILGSTRRVVWITIKVDRLHPWDIFDRDYWRGWLKETKGVLVTVRQKPKRNKILKNTWEKRRILHKGDREMDSESKQVEIWFLPVSSIFRTVIYKNAKTQYVRNSVDQWVGICYVLLIRTDKKVVRNKYL